MVHILGRTHLCAAKTNCQPLLRRCLQSCCNYVKRAANTHRTASGVNYLEIKESTGKRIY